MKKGGRMTAQEYLELFQKEKEILQDDLEELEDLKDKAFSLPSQTASYEQKNKQNICDARFTNDIHLIDFLESKVEQKKTKLAHKEEIIREAISGLSGAEMKVIKYRYIYGMTWELLAEKIGYSYTQAHRIHKKALKNIKLPPKGADND